MRAGKLDRELVIERATTTIDEYGNTIEAWAPLATMRAQLVTASTEEFQRAYGASGETAIVFRTRWLAGVTVSDRVIYEGAHHNIIETKEIGRRRGLELRTRRIGA
ncbi:MULTISPECIES: phage head closure protein [unclassified Mesorhizobium]|uniref:phage head closure protein n=1 Tax=unclassified Mesorhizobium TaxID=325217 RepID=UPI001125FBDC|nr:MULTISPECIES: phage head closure protein [unclassified Mesorhizobium]MBZ9999634.1 phage head closure protein [Mesorhizobium sp. B264B2A]MCA0008108.1 phage head closure protein [Mesorhizobium sp. B264B1B]MCA0018018.1 phage head closure protein [Mesorhizobium sp. B264B1A]TPJ36032.1 head-tail adaptor protein [Mesorhizobium sp. B2-6-6]